MFSYRYLHGSGLQIQKLKIIVAIPSNGSVQSPQLNVHSHCCLLQKDAKAAADAKKGNGNKAKKNNNTSGAGTWPPGTHPCPRRWGWPSLSPAACCRSKAEAWFVHGGLPIASRVLLSSSRRETVFILRAVFDSVTGSSWMCLRWTLHRISSDQSRFILRGLVPVHRLQSRSIIKPLAC